MTIGPGHFAVLSALVFGIGLAGVATRRDATSVVIALVVMMLGPVIAAVGFAQTQSPASASGAATGGALAVVVVAALVAQFVVGAGVLLLLKRRRHSLDLDEVEHLMG